MEASSELSFPSLLSSSGDYSRHASLDRTRCGLRRKAVSAARGVPKLERR